MKCFLILFAALVLAFGQTDAQHQLIWETPDYIVNINDVDFYPEGDRVVNNRKNFIQIRNSSDGSLITEMKVGDHIDVFENEVVSLDVSPDGKYIVACERFHDVVIYDAETYEEIRRIEGFNGPSACHFTSDGKRIIVLEERTGSLPKFTATITICDVVTGNILKEIVEPNGELTSWLAVSPSGNYFAYAQVIKPGRVVIRDQQTYEMIADFNTDFVETDGIQISNSGNFILVYKWNDIYMYDVINKKLERFEPYEGKIYDLEFNNDDSILILSRGGNTEYYSFPEFSLLWKDAPEKSIWGKPMKLDNNDKFALAGREVKLYYYEIDWSPEHSPDNKHDTLQISPVPTENYLRIELPEKNYYQNMEISISDINGKIFFTDNRMIESKSFEIYVDLPAGVYFINLVSTELKKSQKIIVK